MDERKNTQQERIAVVVVPRERGAVAAKSLQSIYDNTSIPFDLVYVDGCLGRSMAARIRNLVKSRNGRYVRARNWLYPNEARNLGLERARSATHVVFIDNDVFVEPGWLDALVTCARQTGAGVVGPLYLEGERDNPLVHCAGGEILQVDHPGSEPVLITRQFELGAPLSELPPILRQATGLIEFHCVLVTRPFLDAIGGRFDEKLRTTREHVDLCLLAREHGFGIQMEPTSRIRYDNEEPGRLGDLDYFMYRWSGEATRETIDHFERKWKVSLDSGRAKIIRDRRQVFRSGLKRSFFSKAYIRAWQAAQRTPLTRAGTRWMHRNVW